MSSVTLTSGNRDITVTSDDAANYLIKYLRSPPPKDLIGFADYGYEIYLENLLIDYGIHELRFDRGTINFWQNERDTISPLFMDACWELCTRGILRPYTRSIDGQGSTNPGFSVTAFGKQWLSESDFDDYVPTSPGRFADMLSPFSKIFGNTFQARAQEAVKCYNAHAFLACCAMSGAAAETILRSIALKLDIDSGNKPISKIREAIISQSGPGVKDGLMAYSDIVKYWRDSGMHHDEFEINANKAYISLAMLLRLSMFADEKWFKA